MDSIQIVSLGLHVKSPLSSHCDSIVARSPHICTVYVLYTVNFFGPLLFAYFVHDFPKLLITPLLFFDPGNVF